MILKRKEYSELIKREDIHKLNDSCEDKLFHDSEDTERNYENLPIDVSMFDTATIPSAE